MDVKKLFKEFRTKRAFRHVHYIYIKTYGTYIECDIRIEGAAQRAIKTVERMADKCELELLGSWGGADQWRFRGRKGHSSLKEYAANLKKLKADLELFGVKVELR